MACNNNTAKSCNAPKELLKTSNPCERICIQAKRIFDACMKQIAIEQKTLTVTFPCTPTALTLISVASFGPCHIKDLTIARLPNSCCSRVRYTVTAPLRVETIDQSGNIVYGVTSVTFNQDILLKLPADALIPAEIECVVKVRGINGSLDGNILTTSICATIITKSVADVDILINTFGYPTIPMCEDFEEDVCSGVFALPLYPEDRN